MPFSDPLADGPVIQRAIERALAGGTTLRGTLDDDPRRRARDVGSPIVLFTYVNPIVRMGEAAFVRAAADAGVDGVLVLDYPVEEAGAVPRSGWSTRASIRSSCSARRRPTRGSSASAELGRGLPVRDLAARRDRRPRSAGRGRRGAGRSASGAQSPLPLALGFGISTPEQVAQVVPLGRRRGRRQRAGAT